MSTANLYCAACKKKFTNEATWQNHIKSAKHLANEKKKKAAGNSPIATVLSYFCS